MSHQPERKEKNCLNCGAYVHGRYCHVCGQENIVTHQGFWPLAKHFVYDIFHFDGKFFHTLYYLFTKPGFVARQYVAGKRGSNLDPIRMYLFTSAIFFLIFFSFGGLEIKPAEHASGRLTKEDRRELLEDYQKALKKNPADSMLLGRIALLLDTSRPLNADSLGWKEDFKVFNFGGRDYRSSREYDSIQAALPPGQKDGWLARRLIRQTIRVNEKYGSSTESVNAYLETFRHKMPYLLFVSLPFFALILKLLYLRRRQFYYSDHAVFTLYHYIFSFILLLLIFGADQLKNLTGWGIFSFVYGLLFLAWPVYLFIEMKNFYGQGKGKTLGKFLLLNLLGLVLLIILFIVFLLFSLFQV